MSCPWLLSGTTFTQDNIGGLKMPGVSPIPVTVNGQLVTPISAESDEFRMYSYAELDHRRRAALEEVDNAAFS